MSEAMLELPPIEPDVLATGKVDGPERERLRREFYAHDKIECREADSLVELHKRVQDLTPAFGQFFYQAVKDRFLAHGRTDAPEAARPRQPPRAGGRFHGEGREFPPEPEGGAGPVGREFERPPARSGREGTGVDRHVTDHSSSLPKAGFAPCLVRRACIKYK